MTRTFEMRLITISGFLGSGKTTLIVKLAEATLKLGLKSAILVNEIGEMGIDNQLMKQLDLNVYQLLGGCLCCTLSSDMPVTLQKLVEEYAPDVVFMEPSGAAELQKVQSALKWYEGKPFEVHKTVILLDALRLGILFKALTPMITSQITGADLILLNKTDSATDEELRDALDVVRQVQPEREVIQIAAKKQLPPELIEEILK